MLHFNLPFNCIVILSNLAFYLLILNFLNELFWLVMSVWFLLDFFLWLVQMKLDSFSWFKIFFKISRKICLAFNKILFQGFNMISKKFWLNFVLGWWLNNSWGKLLFCGFDLKLDWRNYVLGQKGSIHL